MEPISINVIWDLITEGGAIAIFAVAWYLERQERLATNRLLFETLQLNPTSLAVLDRATKIIEGLGK